jgi:hypothetical protein
LSEASSFCLVEKSAEVGKKSAAGEFSLFRFFCSGKRNEMPLRHEQQQSAKALAAIEQKA